MNGGRARKDFDDLDVHIGDMQVESDAMGPALQPLHPNHPKSARLPGLLTHSYSTRCYPKWARARREERNLGIPNTREQSGMAQLAEATRRNGAGLAGSGVVPCLTRLITSRPLRHVSNQSDQCTSIQCAPTGLNQRGVVRESTVRMMHAVGLHMTRGDSPDPAG